MILKLHTSVLFFVNEEEVLEKNRSGFKKKYKAPESHLDL